MSEALLQLESVSLVYETEVERVSALHDVSLTVRAGDFLAISGASGSGKTSLIDVMAGLTLPDDGRVLALGQELSGMGAEQRASARLRGIGVVFQDHNLIPEFTVLDNVALPSRALGITKQAAEREAQSLLTKVGLKDLGDRWPSQLSGGQRQRVGIARGLCGERRIILTDEPTGSLDSTNSRSIFRLLRELADDGVGIVAATHDAAIDEVATRIAHMQDGQLNEQLA